MMIREQARTGSAEWRDTSPWTQAMVWVPSFWSERRYLASS
jgi:hypothetical protein